MKSKNKDIIIESEYPIAAYIGCILYAFVTGLFAYNIIFKELPLIDGILIFSIALFAIDFFLCGYSCKVVLKTNSFEVKYFFPWHTSQITYFERITDVESIKFQYYGFHGKIYIEYDGSIRKYYRIQSNFGLLKDIYDLASTIKSVFKLE